MAVGRAPRHSLPDGYYHVSSRSVAERRLFVDDDDRSAFVRLLSSCGQRQEWVLHAFTLLSTHYHLVVETTRANLSAGLHRLNGRYARYFNGRHKRYGHVFSGRFSARRIDSDTYLYDACEYVLMNPVSAGLCNLAEEWPWSYSRLDYSVGRATPREPRPTTAL